MKKFCLQMQQCVALLMLLFFTCCNGQVNTNLPSDKSDSSLVETQPSPVRHPKIVKTQGTDNNQNVQCALQDRAGNIWFGTTGEGLYRYDADSLFTHFTMKDGLNSNVIWSMAEDRNGNIWIGTSDGICRYHQTPPKPGLPASGTFTSIPIIVSNRSNFLSDDSLNHNAWPKNAVMSILEDRTGTLWFGTGDGVYCYNANDGTFTYFLNNPGVINNNNLFLKGAESILEDKDGYIWFGGRSWDMEGVCRFDGKNLINFKPKNEAWLRPLIQDKSGIIWFCSRTYNIYRYDPSAGEASEQSFTRFGEKEITDWVFNMVEDKSGNLWFSNGKNGGVTCYDPHSSPAFKNFTSKDGLCHNSVWCMLEDKAGNIWFGTKNTSLCRYDPRLKTFTNFN